MKARDRIKGRAMRFCCLLLCCVVMLGLSAHAQGEAAGKFALLPQEVQALERERGGEDDILDVLLIENTPRGEDLGLAFRQHKKGLAPGIQGTAGLVYPDDLGFDILCKRKGENSPGSDLIQYHWQGEGFSLVGWQEAGSGQLTIYKEGKWQYHDAQSGAALGAVEIEPLVTFGFMVYFMHLPHSLYQAQGMAAITEAAAAVRYPGWTLASYSAYNDFHMADADYYRIEDGVLQLRRVVLHSKLGKTREVFTMPLPLSKGLLARLETEDFDSLMDASGMGDLFLTPDAFDVTAIPVRGKLVHSDLQSRGLLLMTEEEEGQRFLHWVVQEGANYRVERSRVLPKEASLDLFHTGDDGMLLSWDGQRYQASFGLNPAGRFMMTWFANYSADKEFSFGVLPFGLRFEGSFYNLNSVRMGSLPGRDAFQMDFLSLPITEEAVNAALDQSGWAVVNNTKPTDRLHLRAKPDKASLSLGKFYNRTPVKVLGQEGPWCRVQIGVDGHLVGYMMKEYLAFGADMDRVASAMPDLVLKEDYETRPGYQSRDLKKTAQPLSGHLYIIGVVENRLYIVMDDQGSTAYYPQDWLFEGNG